MHTDHIGYHPFTSARRLSLSLNSLAGIIEGITIDNAINQQERDFLSAWIEQHIDRRGLHPFSELIPVVEAAISDGVLTEDEAQDIQWLIERMLSRERIDDVTADLQRLHAVLGGIIADGYISDVELRGLSDWMEARLHLQGCWPYDEIGHLLAKVLADGRVDESEQHQLQQFFGEFVVLADDQTITSPPVKLEGSLIGLCAIGPEIFFDKKGFCFTGASYKGKRSELAAKVSDRGGFVHSNPSRKVDYLVIGAEGNPCWSFACYGRKVERAVELRKQGVRIMIVHERDFHDALVD